MITINFAPACKTYDKTLEILSALKERRAGITLTKGNGTDYLYETGWSCGANEAFSGGAILLSEYNRLAKILGKTSKMKNKFAKGTSWHHNESLRKIDFINFGLCDEYDIDDLVFEFF